MKGKHTLNVAGNCYKRDINIMAPTVHVNREDVEFSGKDVKFFSIQLTSVIGVDVVWTGIFGLEGGAGKKVIIIHCTVKSVFI
jgi:hypothetical protein